MDRSNPPAFRSKLRVKHWLVWLSVACAALAAGALVLSATLASQAVNGASSVIARGEAAATAALIAGQLRDKALTGQALQEALAEHANDGLRYLAVTRPPRHGTSLEEVSIVSAGERRIPGKVAHPGDMIRQGARVLLVAALPHRPGNVGGPRAPDFAFPPRGGPLALVLELEAPVGAKLSSELVRITLFAGIAGLILLAVALGWSRSLLRLGVYERAAERERGLVALGRMSSVLAHELRNPLASLKGHAQLLAEDLDEKSGSHAKALLVVAEAERLEVLQRSLLMFVRDGPLESQAVIVAALLDTALVDLPRERFEVDTSGAPPHVRLDIVRASRALHNLLENALQATPDGLRVHVVVRQAADAVVIDVRDFGPGLQQPSEQLFEPFVTTRTKGTGLGLAVARRVAEQHGGSLTGQNVPGGGALFRLTLPL